MSKRTEAELLAAADMLSAVEKESHYKTCEKILHRCYIIIGILSVSAILLGVFVYEYAAEKVEMRALRETQTKAHRIMWVFENIGEINLKTGRPVGEGGGVGRTMSLVRGEHWNWNWPFQHPINPGQTFRHFAEQSYHPFAVELKKHLDNPKKHLNNPREHWQQGQGKYTNEKARKNSNKGDDLS